MLKWKENMYKLLKKSKKTQARIGILTTPHGRIETPFFMPIATKASVKALTANDVTDLGAQIILANTYHLYLQPGLEIIKKFGGLHKFMNWPGPILTDSGGYQVFSLGEKKKYGPSGENFQGPKSRYLTKTNDENLSLVKITNDGVEFKSFIDGSKHFFSPEKVQDIQDVLGSDIKMVLDVCSPHPCAKSQAEHDMKLTHEWAKRAIEYHNLRSKKQELRSKGLLFGIVQGSVYKDLRLKSTKFLSNLNFDGLAIGGLAVGEDNKKMYSVLDYTLPVLPSNKPRYLMGVGRPENIIEAVKRGIDMFDCVIPTREARHGRLYKMQKTINKKQFYEIININNAKFKKDIKPIDKNCDCELCRNYSAGYLHHLFKAGEPLALRLATSHNVKFYLKLMTTLRELIQNNKL